MAKIKRKNYFKILLTVGAIVMVWRGIWGLADLYLFPNHPELSYIASVIIGLIILFIDDRRLDELVQSDHHHHDSKH